MTGFLTLLSPLVISFHHCRRRRHYHCRFRRRDPIVRLLIRLLVLLLWADGTAVHGTYEIDTHISGCSSACLYLFPTLQVIASWMCSRRHYRGRRPSTWHTVGFVRTWKPDELAGCVLVRGCVCVCARARACVCVCVCVCLCVCSVV